MKEWYSARDLAEIALPGVPKRPQEIVRRATREGWIARAREGRGGGCEYHISGLPAAARDVLAVRAAQIAGQDGPSPLSLSPTGERGEDPKLDHPGPRFHGDDREETVRHGPRFHGEGRAAAAVRRDAAACVVRLFERFRAAQGLSALDAEARFLDFWRAQAGKAGSDAVPGWVVDAIPCFSARTLRRWRAQAQRNAARIDGRRAKARSPFEINEFLRDFTTALSLKQPHLTAGHLRDLCRAQFGDDLPSIRAFQRFLTNWKRDNAPAIQRICAPDDWRSHRLIAVGSASAHVERLNQVWEIDASPADMLCTGGRYTIYALVDIYSRRLIVSVTKTPRTEAVLLLIRRGILEWGVPEILKTDNGSDFTSKRFMTALMDLGIEQDLCTPFNPQLKPHVERAIGTLQRDLMPTLPGFVGHSVADRKKIEQRRAFGQRLGEGAEKAFSVALDADALQGYIDSWTREKYAHRPHGGLNGLTPFSRAMSWTGAIRRVESERALDLLLAPIAGQDGFRTVSKKGIRIERGAYFGAGLAGYVGQRVFCRCDPEDLGKIYVFTENMKFICEAENIDRLGVDRAAAAAQAVADQKRFAREQIEPLKRAMKKIDAFSVADTLRDLYAKDNGAIASFPKASETHTTPALEAAQDAAAPRPAHVQTTPEQEEGYRKLREEYESGRTAPAAAPAQTDEERWWNRRAGLQARMARGEPLSETDIRWLETTRNSYWVTAREDFEAFAKEASER